MSNNMDIVRVKIVTNLFSLKFCYRFVDLAEHWTKILSIILGEIVIIRKKKRLKLKLHDKS